MSFLFALLASCPPAPVLCDDDKRNPDAWVVPMMLLIVGCLVAIWVLAKLVGILLRRVLGRPTLLRAGASGEDATDAWKWLAVGRENSNHDDR